MKRVSFESLHIKTVIRYLRLASGMTLKEMSEKLSIAISIMSGLETGRYIPDESRQREIADIFGISLEQFNDLVLFAYENDDNHRKVLKRCIEVLDEADCALETAKAS